MSNNPLNIDDFGRRISVGFIVLIWILAPYMLLQQFAFYQPFELSESAFDQKIPVRINAVYVYWSYIFLLAAAGFYAPTSIFVRFLRCICVVCLVSHLTFFFFPTTLARPELTGDAPLLYQWTVALDKPRNCLPSLHASLAVLATLALWKKHWLVGVLAFVWSVAVLWSAIALRQHVTVDLAAGSMLAGLVWYGVSLYEKKQKFT